MKHAIVITAYTDYLMLRLLCEIYHKDFLVYIHVDKMSESITDEHIQELNQIENVYAIRKYKCYWGSLNHLQALIDMSKEALKNPDVNYIHFSTGQDLPIKSNEEIKDFFEKSGNKSFLNFHFPDAHYHKPELEMWKYYYFICNDCDPREVPYCDWIKEMVDWQKKNNICKKGLGEFTKIYKGIIWSSFTREALEYCYKYIDKHPQYWEDVKYSRIREEFCFHTILFNTPYFDDKIVRDGKHGWKWAGSGQFLNMEYEDYIESEKKGKLFIRKVTSSQTELINSIISKFSEFRLDGRKIFFGNKLIYKGKKIKNNTPGYTGLKRNVHGWWYMKDGRPDTTYTGMAKNEYGWWYVKEGRIDFTFDGVAENEHGMWKFTKGKLDCSYNGSFMWNGQMYNIVNGRAQK